MLSSGLAENESAKVPTIVGSSFGKSVYLLCFSSFFYDGELNIFGFWTAGQIKQDI